MPRNSEIKQVSEYFQLPNPGLLSYFGNVRRGNDQEYRTTFYKGKSVQEVLDSWMPTLKPLSTEWPTLWEYENDLAKKVGPMSIQKPLSERMDDIDSYYDSILLESTPISKSAVAAVSAEWSKLGGLNLRSQRKVVENMKLSTNSGNPYFQKRRSVLDKTVPLTIEYRSARNKPAFALQHLPGKTWPSCAVLGWRGQEGGPEYADVKQRVVWMFPFGVNVEELRVYQPAIESAQRFGLVPAWNSMDAVDSCITHMFDTKGKEDLVVCTDFTKFDQHFNTDMQDCAKAILSNILNTSNAEVKQWLDNVFPVKYNIPLMYDVGKLRFGHHGMGSGSGGTNFDETLTHRALQYEAAQAAKQKLNVYSQCLGDDGILTFPGINVEDVTLSYASHGQDMNVDKQYASALDCTYLRRWHHTGYRYDGVCVGVYATSRALGRLCEQERYYDPEVWSKEMVALRQLSIIENCKYHPLREKFVEFCMKGDKYQLGLGIPGFMDSITKYARDAIDYMPDFLGYSRSMERAPAAGISEWWIVKYLKSK